MPGQNKASKIDKLHRWGTVTLDIILAGGALVVLLVSFVLAPDRLPRIPICPFMCLTGLPCAGCGITRAFCAIGHGDYGEAWNYNPFAFIFYALTIAFAFYPLTRRLWPDLHRRLLLSRWAGSGVLLLFATMLIFGAARIVGMLWQR